MDYLLNELCELRERMQQLIPLYKAALVRVAQMPVEFDRRWWLSRVDILLQEIRGEYQKYQDLARQAESYAKLVMPAVDAAFRASGMEPAPPPASQRTGISISPSGKIEPAMLEDSPSEKGGVLVTFEVFQSICLRLQQDILNGIIRPENEEGMPKLIHSLASKWR